MRPVVCISRRVDGALHGDGDVMSMPAIEMMAVVAGAFAAEVAEASNA